VPAFRVKQDIIPGQVIEFEFTPIREGRYRLRDSQYSGTYFAAMQTDVVVESPEDYQQWQAAVATQAPAAAYNLPLMNTSVLITLLVQAGKSSSLPLPQLLMLPVCK
jgi:cytochrome c oxidase subunit 2